MCGGKVAIPPILKEKRKNSEKRKEKSRDAARCRRSKESEIFSDLSHELPVASSVTANLDKASIMRLTLSYIKVKEMMKLLLPLRIDFTQTLTDKYCATVLSGFVLILSTDGDVLFLSENVEEFLGIHWAEMIGNRIYDSLHPCDHDEVKTLLASSPSREGTLDADDFQEKEVAISMFLRMKSNLKNKGRAGSLKSSPYQVIHFIGHKFNRPLAMDERCDASERENPVNKVTLPALYLMFIGKPIPHPVQIDDPLSNKEIFVSRHSPDMKFTHIDDRISEFLGYKSSELIGKSAYSFHHVLDSEALLASFKTLFSKGQVETGYYRFLSKHGGYVWVVTQATLIYENGPKPECVVCLNYVLSNIEHQDEIVCEQQEQREQVEEVEEDNESHPALLLSTTCAIFTPKDTVMSTHFLNFPDTDILLFPLKDSKLQLDLDLFPDDPCSLGNGICDDPFSYRDDSLSSYCGTPESSLNLPLSNSTSPDRFNTTPNTPDSGSLSDIPSLDPIDEFSNLDLKFTMPPSVSDKDSECYEENLDFRAPFIPMQMDDDFPLISPSSSVMWGPQDHLPKKSPLQERLSEPEPQRNSPKQKLVNENSLKSSLAALLQSDVKKTPLNKQQDKNGNNRVPQKRWPISTVDNNKNSSVRQRNFTPSKNYTNNGNSGHIIILDSIPVKKQPIKSNPSQKRNGQSTTGDRRSNSPQFGSHTSTVRVNDRLIKVQVSVSELPTVPIEHKQPFPSPPDPPPKRASPSRPGPTESPKRLKVDNGLACSGSRSVAGGDSVLLNLLISGEDASRGYLCSGNSRYSENKFEPAVLSLPSNDSNKLSSDSTELLASESELLDSFLKLSQYDAEVNAPLQSSHLLHGDDLLTALDHPLLRNVTAV